MKNSSYEIDGDLYEFDNAKLGRIITTLNPNRGAKEQFYRKVVGLNVGISYDTVKGWVKNKTNPSLEDVKIIANVLGVPYMQLLECTHYGVEKVKARIQQITFTEVLDPFSLRYDDFSNVLDMIIGRGYDKVTGECRNSDFAERLMSIIFHNEREESGIPELLGFKFIYTDEELGRMGEEELTEALWNGYVDNEGNRLYDDEHRISIDKKRFCKKILENATWLGDEDYAMLQKIIAEAERWWNYCEMPFALLKVNINAFGHRLASYTYGPGWVNPTHGDRWRLILDILTLLGTQVEITGLCWVREMHVDQLESEMFLTIEAFKYF